MKHLVIMCMGTLVQVHADLAMSVSELKKNPMAVVKEAAGRAVAILNRNSPAFYCVPPEVFEAMLDAIDDQELAKLINERASETPIPVDLSEL